MEGGLGQLRKQAKINRKMSRLSGKLHMLLQPLLGCIQTYKKTRVTYVSIPMFASIQWADLFAKKNQFLENRRLSGRYSSA